MRFACIEYTTKSRTIWRPTPERPNYLCDPEKEIDPTSFGCYTSALSGDHVPLTGLIYGSLEHPPARWQRARQDLARWRTGAFRPYDLSSLRGVDLLLVIYQSSNDDELVRFVERARRELPSTILVSSSSPPFGRLREAWKDYPTTAERYRSFVNTTHFNMNVCRATVPWYRAFCTTPSLYLPQPYPVEYAMQQAAGNRQKAEGHSDGHARLAGDDPVSNGRLRASGHGSEGERASSRSEESPLGIPSGRLETGRRADEPPMMYVAGDTVRPDIMTGHLVAKELQHRHPDLLIRVTKTPEFQLNTSFLAGTRFEVVPFRPWAEQLRELANVRLVINTDLWWTRGRVAVDCAAASVPCVGTTSDGQAELWPDLSAGDSLETDRLVQLAERALTDEAFRASVVGRARRRLENYSYTHTVERLQRAVALARAGRLTEWRDPVWEDDVLRFSDAHASV